MDYEDFLQEKLFRPCGMVDSSFRIKGRRHRVVTYTADVAAMMPPGLMALLRCLGKERPKVKPFFVGEKITRGDGGLNGSLDDFIKLGTMICNKGVAPAGVRVISEVSACVRSIVHVHVRAAAARFFTNTLLLTSNNHAPVMAGSASHASYVECRWQRAGATLWMLRWHAC